MHSLFGLPAKDLTSVITVLKMKGSFEEQDDHELN